MLRIILAAVAATLFTFTAFTAHAGMLDGVTILRSRTVELDPTRTSAYGVEQYDAKIKSDRTKRLDRFVRVIGESADELERSAIACHRVDGDITAAFSEERDPVKASFRFDQYNAAANAMGVTAEEKMHGLIARGTIPAQCLSLVGLTDGTYELRLRTGTGDRILTNMPAKGHMDEDAIPGTIPSWTNMQALGQADRYGWVVKDDGTRFPILHGSVDEVVTADPVLPETDHAPVPTARPGS